MRAIIRNPDAPLLGMAGALLTAALICGLISPSLFELFLVAAVATGCAFLALRFPTPACVAWLLLTGMSLEMTFHDLIGGDIYHSVIAAVKGMQMALAFVCVLRFGPKLDLLCPAWAFLAMLLEGMAHGLYPGLSTIDSLRSAIGSAAPFAFCFARVPQSWADSIIRATKWCPVTAVAASLPIAATGLRPLFVDSGGARLQALGHPAFLAFVCLPAIYACLLQLYREGRRGDLLLLIVNGMILALTGARAPLFYAVAVTAVSLLTIHSRVFGARDRVLLVLGTLAVLPVVAIFAGDLDDVRLVNVVVHDTGNLSGRSLLWPTFEDAAALSPWFGWGIGAGNKVIPPEAELAQLLHTSAAHNEYLRLDVEGGLVGRTLLIVMFATWVIVRTHGLLPSDRRIMRLAYLALAGHAVTDNVLISTPACVLFAFTSAVFARPDPRPDLRRAEPDGLNEDPAE